MPLAYIPIAQASDGMLRLVHSWFSPAFIVRSAGSTDASISVLRRALDATDGLLPFARTRAMDEVQAASLARERLLTALLGGLALAAVLPRGGRDQRTHRGIRYGADARDGHPDGAGREPAAGAPIARAAGRRSGAGGHRRRRAGRLSLVSLLRHFLWGLAPTDLPTFAGVAAVLMTIATIASVVPALRILKLDPADTLRHDR